MNTAQTRLLLTLGIAVAGQPSLLLLPLYIEIASATATLSSISCPAWTPTSSSVTISATPSVANAWIGAVSNAQFDNFSTPVTPPAAAILNVAGLGSVTAFAHAAITNLTPTTLNFSYSEISKDTGQSISTTDFVASLVSSLFGSLQLGANVLGLNITIPSALSSNISTALMVAATPIDQVLDSVLTTVGVSLGNATVWVGGVQCGSSVLVH